MMEKSEQEGNYKWQKKPNRELFRNLFLVNRSLWHMLSPIRFPSLYEKMGLIDARGAIGIFTITPSEGAIIAADVATKAADVSIGFVDRFNGTLIICGDVAAVESALREVMHTLCEMMGFTPTVVTKT